MGLDTFLTHIFVLICLMNYPEVATAMGEASCIDLSLCNLIRGDLAWEAEKFDEQDKYIKAAKEDLVWYKHAIHGNKTIRMECQRLLPECTKDAAKMAVEDLKFPAKYQSECNYKSYSRTIFDCKNIKNWPEEIKYLPREFTDCRLECIITEENEIKLINDKVVNTKHMGALGSEDVDVDAEADEIGLEGRSMSLWMRTDLVYSGLDPTNKTSGPEWGKFTKCPEDRWVNMVDYVTRGDYLYYVSMACTASSNYSSQSTFIESTVVEPKPKEEEWSTEYEKRWGPRCNNQTAFPGNPQNSFVVGVSLHLAQYKTFGKILKHVNYLCGNQNTTTWWTLGAPDTKEMLCPNQMAVCSLQTKSASFENKKFLVDLVIGCCIPDENNMNGFLQKGGVIQSGRSWMSPHPGVRRG